MPWKTLCGFPTNQEKVKLMIPNGAWRADTVITDSEGIEYFVVLEVDMSMRTYEAVFGDLNGQPLVCVKRHLKKAVWKDGYYFCTYRPIYRGQKPFYERDINHRKIYPHSYLEVIPMKGTFHYRFVDEDRQLTRARLSAQNPWMGFMMGCCTCLLRCGRFTCKFKKRDNSVHIFVDQWRNLVKVAPHNDLLAALCIAYVFDKCQCQPMVTLYGAPEEDYSRDEGSDDSGSFSEEEEDGQPQVEMKNVQRQKMPAGYIMPSMGEKGPRKQRKALQPKQDGSKRYLTDSDQQQEDQMFLPPGQGAPYRDQQQEDQRFLPPGQGAPYRDHAGNGEASRQQEPPAQQRQRNP